MDSKKSSITILAPAKNNEVKNPKGEYFQTPTEMELIIYYPFFGLPVLVITVFLLQIAFDFHGFNNY